jgi:hypothetical protein
VKTASLSLDDPPTDEEWLLLRNETQPPRTIKDKFAQIHPLVRKYASYYHPEMKPGEPQWANAVQSRQWELEETLQRDKTELAKSLETGIPDSWPMTCMTESQERAYRLAMETLMLMRKYAGETDLEKNHVDELQTQDA